MKVERVRHVEAPVMWEVIRALTGFGVTWNVHAQHKGLVGIVKPTDSFPRACRRCIAAGAGSRPGTGTSDAESQLEGPAARTGESGGLMNTKEWHKMPS